MPKETSTFRRKRLADRIESLGSIMPRKCATYRLYSRTYRVHISFGRCRECVRRGLSDYDVKILESE